MANAELISDGLDNSWFWSLWLDSDVENFLDCFSVNTWEILDSGENWEDYYLNSNAINSSWKNWSYWLDEVELLDKDEFRRFEEEQISSGEVDYNKLINPHTVDE